MSGATRYRTGMDSRSGRTLRGWPAVAQSLERLWTTRLGARAMRLDFGSGLPGRLGQDLTPATALDIYQDLVSATHRFEPEYRILTLQVVRVTAIGALGLRHAGRYFPEGRFGNYEISETVGALVTPRLARAAAL